MTEQQFTPEYRAYMQSDEAKRLQDAHLVELGEWRVLMPVFGMDHPWFVTKGDEYGLSVEGTRADGHKVACLYARERSRWLPTLFQLIGVIEGAGFRWYHRTNGTWGIHREGDADRWEMNDKQGDMFAAAKLAVKAVEGKG